MGIDTKEIMNIKFILAKELIEQFREGSVPRPHTQKTYLEFSMALSEVASRALRKFFEETKISL
jgi:hypothetical protein